VTLYWEDAFGKEYFIKISDGVGGWVDVYHETNGDGGMDRISVGALARKIMMLGVQRGTPYGYSLYEFQVNGSPTTSVEEPSGVIPSDLALDEPFPNPFNPSTQIRFSLAEPGECTLAVFDLLGRQVATLIDGVRPAGMQIISWNASGQPAGVYFCRLQTAGIVIARKLVLAR
jgi:hypothetical protein